MNATRRLPTLFISHGGGPWPWMDFGPRNPYEGLARYLREYPEAIGAKPKAILAISGHWEEPEFTVMGSAKPPMIYDYSGFPEHTYHIRYDAPGSPQLARRVRELLDQAGIPSREDPRRGYDHGVFTPFSVSHPKADIPIVQLSIKNGYDPKAHIALGRALAPLRDEGVLIVGSGLSYHNLRAFGPHAYAASKAFDDWLTDAVTAKDAKTRNEKLAHWSEAPSARIAHPKEDHLVPLMVASGAAGEDLGVKNYSDKMMGVEVSGFRFG
jgi:aromatic ring-opening dioxygenase catalytic subunit (LigB family)